VVRGPAQHLRRPRRARSRSNDRVAPHRPHGALRVVVRRAEVLAGRPAPLQLRRAAAHRAGQRHDDDPPHPPARHVERPGGRAGPLHGAQAHRGHAAGNEAQLPRARRRARPLGLPLPPAVPHGSGHVPRSAGARVRRPALPATLLLACIAPTIAQAQHAGHHPPPEEDPHAGHAMPADEDPHAGHAMPADADPHAGHVMPPTASDTLLAPREPIPPLTDADRAAAFPDVAGHAVHDTARHAFVLVDRLETWDDDAPGVPLGWEILAWHGTDLRRTWLRTEGEASDRGIDHADIELLHGRAVAPWWDALAGVRHRIG